MLRRPSVEALRGGPPWRPVPWDVGSECKSEMIAGISNVLNLSVWACMHTLSDIFAFRHSDVRQVCL